jgi:hypothetical protein
MDYEGYAKPALQLALARLQSEGGCMGCRTCGGFAGEKIARSVYNRNRVKQGYDALKGKELKKKVLEYFNKRSDWRKKKYGEEEKLLKQCAVIKKRIAIPRKKQETVGRKQTKARSLFKDRIAEVSKLMKQGMSKVDAWEQAMKKYPKNKPAKKKGSGLEYGMGLQYGRGLEYDDGMSYY